jgi:hypothetical protein
MSTPVLTKQSRKDTFDIDTDIVEDDKETTGCGTTVIKLSAIKISNGGLVSARNVLYMPLPLSLADAMRTAFSQPPGSTFYSGRAGTLRSKLDKPNRILFGATLRKGYAEKEAGRPYQPGVKALEYDRSQSGQRVQREFKEITDDLLGEEQQIHLSSS